MAKTSESVNQESRTDLQGITITLLVVIIAVFWQYTIIEGIEVYIRAILAITALVAALLYFYRIRRLTYTTSTPIADTLIIVTGLFLALTLVGQYALDTFQSSIEVPLLLLGIAVMSKLLLLDDILNYVLTQLVAMMQWVVTWLFNRIKWLGSPLNTIRAIIFVTGYFLIFGTSLLGLGESIYNVVGWDLLGIGMIINLIISRQTPPSRRGRLASGIVLLGSLISLIILLEYQISTLLETISIVIVAILTMAWLISTQAIVRFFYRQYIVTKYMLFRFGSRIRGAIIGLFGYIRSHPVKSAQITGFILGFVFLFFFIFTANTTFGILAVASYAIAVIPSAIELVKDLARPIYQFVRDIIVGIYDLIQSALHFVYTSFKEHPVGSIQVVALVLIPFAYFFVPSENDLNLWTVLLLFLIGIIPSIIRLILNIAPVVWGVVVDTYKLITKYPVETFQVLSLVSIIPVQLFVPSNPVVLDMPLRRFASILLLVAAISPSVWRLILRIYRPVLRTLKIIFSWLSSQLQSWESYVNVASVTGVISLFFIPNEEQTLKLGVVVITTILIVFSGHFYLPRFYDGLILGIFRFILPVVRFVRFLLPQLSLGLVLSFLAIVMLLLSLSFRIFFPSASNSGVIRLSLFVLSVFLWNIAYRRRWERFVGFWKRFSRRLAKWFEGFGWWILRNIWLILLWFVALTFAGFGLGLIIGGLVPSSTIPVVSTIFGSVLENLLVSVIIGGFLISMAGFTLRLTLQRRSDLQIDVAPREGER